MIEQVKALEIYLVQNQKNIYIYLILFVMLLLIMGMN